MILTGFRNRAEAGQSLARHFERYAGDDNVVVLGLPRGGIPPAFEIAKFLKAPLDVFVVGKLGFPGQPELALGAVSSNGAEVFNLELLEDAGLSKAELDKLTKRKIRELADKESLFRRGKPAIPLKGRTIILVDDGSATGASMRVAIQALRRLGPEYVIAAVPVASVEGLQSIQEEADETVCLQTPEPFHAVGHWYEDFQQVMDEEVIQCLDMAGSWKRNATDREKSGSPVPDSKGPVSISIRTAGVVLSADLTLPRNSTGLILFAHGSGSSRHSRRNRQVAGFLNGAGFATLLMDLLTSEEERIDRDTGELRFDIGLLAERLVGAMRWVLADSTLSQLKAGYFGASTGAAAALRAAARLPGPIGAVVSRGGRPDLAGDALPDVLAPTLLIVGGEDDIVLNLNRQAMESMRCVKKLEIIPGATHLFEEPGTLDVVSELANQWFLKHLSGADSGKSS